MPPDIENQKPLIRIQSVNKVYRMGEVDVYALRDASIDVMDGEFLCIVGPSGSGKTTLLNMIGGMDRPSSGHVLFEGNDLADMTDQQLTMFRRKQIGFIFQFFNLIPTLTAKENVQVAVALSDNPIDPIDALAQVGLDTRADHFPAQLSGGQQQRVAIARALAGNPRLILCDEPTGALDSDTSNRLLDMLSHLNQTLNKTVVLITHDTSLTSAADRVAVIRDGRIVSIKDKIYNDSSNEKPAGVDDSKP